MDKQTAENQHEAVETNSAMKAIRLKCLDCSNSPSEVAGCNIDDCPLWEFRFGRKPIQKL